MPEPLKPRSFKLSETTIANLKDVSLARGNTLSGTLRQLIHHAYEHQVLGIPRCASGNPCLVPATWEQHIALRKLAEARAETDSVPPNTAIAETRELSPIAALYTNNPEQEHEPDLQPIVGQTDLEPDALPKKRFRDFLSTF